MIRICSDMEMLSRAAAEVFVETAVESIRARGRFVVALSGGQTPRRTYELLAQPDLAGRVDWSLVHLFWSDERCVEPDDPRSSERLARRSLLDRVNLPPEQVHPFRCQGDIEESARAYESLLIRFFASDPPRFDLILLGLGRDGHTASLFPHTVSLIEPGRWTAGVSLREEPEDRVTFSPTLINHARKVLFLVVGPEKAEVLREVLEGPLEPDRLPAQLIRPQGETLWLVDRQAAGLLQRKGDAQ